MNRAAIYARVATDESSDESELKQQVGLLREYADRHDYDIIQVYQEVASGVNEERLELENLMRDAAAGLFDVVLFLSPSRLFRNLGLFQEYYRRLRYQHGITVVFALYQDDFTGGEV